MDIAGNWAGTFSDQSLTPPVENAGTTSLAPTEAANGNLNGTINSRWAHTSPAVVFPMAMSWAISPEPQVGLISPTASVRTTVPATVDATGIHMTGTYDFESLGMGCGESGMISLEKQ